MIYKDCNYCNYNIIWWGDFNYSSKSGGLDKIKILSTTSNIYWKYFCTNKLQDISIAKYCQAQPSPSLPGLSSYISKTRVSSKVRLFDRFQFKDSEFDRFEKLDSCAALMMRQHENEMICFKTSFQEKKRIRYLVAEKFAKLTLYHFICENAGL